MSDYSIDEMIQRFAISGLSKERKDEAVNEEILIGKYTGEFFIKSKDGVVISTDILNRLNSAMGFATKCAETYGIVGNMYRVELDNISMPSHIDYSVNLLETEPITLDGCKKILFNFDYDEYDIIGDSIRSIGSDAVVKISMDVKLSSGTTEQIVLDKSIQVINYSVIDLSQFVDVSSVVVRSIIIDKDEKTFNADANDRTIILHNLFISMNV